MLKTKLLLRILILVIIVNIANIVLSKPLIAYWGTGDGILFIDENGYDDGKLPVSHYAPQCSLEPNKNIKRESKATINYTTSGDKTVGKADDHDALIVANTANNKVMDVQIKLNSNGKIYMGDTLKVIFYVIDESGPLQMIEEGTALFDENNEEEYQNSSYKATVSSSYNSSGTHHVKVTVNITLLDKGIYDIPIKLCFEDSKGCEAKITIKTPYVYDLSEQVDSLLTNKGFRLVSGLSNSYGPVAKAKAWMRKQGIVPEDKINSCGITFKKYTLEEDKTIDTLKKGDVTFNDITSGNQNKTPSTFQIDPKTGSGNWATYTMIQGKSYTVEYDFMYNTYNDGLYYKILIDEKGSTTNIDGNKKIDDDLDDDLKDYAENKKRILNAITSIKDDRTNNANFVDVLENTDYYTNVGDIDPDSAGKVESKMSVVLTVITNVGIVISVIMVAVIGIKYILGSVEEKAEYKKDMIPYLVGAGLLFSISTVVKILQTIGNSINSM